MRAGIVGLPGAGKTTLFRMLTRVEPAGHGREPTIGVVPVPDRRFDKLVEMYNPKKLSPATIEFVDGMDDTRGGQEMFDATFMDFIREADALIHVVRDFHSDMVPHLKGSVDPLRDATILTSELILADLQLVERRLERIDKPEKGKGVKLTPAQVAQLKAVLLRLKAILEEEGLVRSANLTPEEREALVGLQFLTDKPMIAVVNVDESAIGQPDTPELAALREYLDPQEVPMIALCAAVEMEIAQLGAEEEQQYFEAMGIEESGRTRLIREAYQQCGLFSFFTAGEPEVHAWTIHRGQTAVDAAGRIHTDLARGFIRAEVVSYDHLIEDGSWNVAKERGHFRLEGKEYVMQDGDVVYIRFKV